MTTSPKSFSFGQGLALGATAAVVAVGLYAGLNTADERPVADLPPNPASLEFKSIEPDYRPIKRIEATKVLDKAQRALATIEATEPLKAVERIQTFVGAQAEIKHHKNISDIPTLNVLTVNGRVVIEMGGILITENAYDLSNGENLHKRLQKSVAAATDPEPTTELGVLLSNSTRSASMASSTPDLPAATPAPRGELSSDIKTEVERHITLAEAQLGRSMTQAERDLIYQGVTGAMENDPEKIAMFRQSLMTMGTGWAHGVQTKRAENPANDRASDADIQGAFTEELLKRSDDLIAAAEAKTGRAWTDAEKANYMDALKRIDVKKAAAATFGNDGANTAVGAANKTEEMNARAANVSANNAVIYPAIGERRMIVSIFSDVTCPRCQTLHTWMEEIQKQGIEVREVVFPRGGMRTGLAAEMQKLYCVNDMADRRQALHDLYTRQRSALLDTAQCTPEQTKVMGDILAYVFADADEPGAVNITGTPTMFASTGRRANGLPADRKVRTLVESLGMQYIEP